MAERGILFSGDMVRAILSGAKTQTRRVVRAPKGVCAAELAHAIEHMQRFEVCDVIKRGPCDGVSARVRCPHGKPGDRLWVRETWAAFTYPDYFTGECDEVMCRPSEMQERHGTSGCDVVYAADQKYCPNTWRPSLFMPRWASRIDLEINRVRVERLHAISEADAVAEGCASVAEYRELWERINGAGSWDANPWVWVVDFRRVGS